LKLYISSSSLGWVEVEQMQKFLIMHYSSQSKLSHLNLSSSEYTHYDYDSVSVAKTENEHNIVMWFKFQIHVICSYTMFPARIKIEHTHTHYVCTACVWYELKLLISSLGWVEVEVEQMQNIFDHAWPWPWLEPEQTFSFKLE